MTTAELRIHDHLPEKILVSRESARLLAEPLRQALAGAQAVGGPVDVVSIDFARAEGMAPSFLDELVGVLQSECGTGARIRFVRQPARLSRKFEAVARGRGLQVAEIGAGEWVLERAGSPSPGGGSRT